MPDDPYRIPASSTGTVTAVRKCGSGRDAWFQVDVNWDNGRTLMLVVPPDQFEVLPGGVKKSTSRWHPRLMEWGLTHRGETSPLVRFQSGPSWRR
jgi:hypothetical protein